MRPRTLAIVSLTVGAAPMVTAGLEPAVVVCRDAIQPQVALDSDGGVYVTFMHPKARKISLRSKSFPRICLFTYASYSERLTRSGTRMGPRRVPRGWHAKSSTVKSII